MPAPLTARGRKCRAPRIPRLTGNVLGDQRAPIGPKAIDPAGLVQSDRACPRPRYPMQRGQSGPRPRVGPGPNGLPAPGRNGRKRRSPPRRGAPTLLRPIVPPGPKGGAPHVPMPVQPPRLSTPRRDRRPVRVAPTVAAARPGRNARSSRTFASSDRRRGLRDPWTGLRPDRRGPAASRDRASRDR
jgi:hypothetical protein